MAKAGEPNYEHLFLSKRLQPQADQTHRELVESYLRFYKTSEVYEELKEHYEPLLAVQYKEEAEEELEETAGDDKVLTKDELNGLLKKELVELAKDLGIEPEGKLKKDYVKVLLNHYEHGH